MNARPQIKKNPAKLDARERLGLNQEEYAHFCQINKAHLAQVEIGRRNLPLKAFQLDAMFVIAEHECQKKPLPENPSFEKLGAEEQEEIALVYYKLKSELNRLKKLEAKERFLFEQAFRLNEVCQVLKPQLTAPEHALSAAVVKVWDLESKMKQQQFQAWKGQLHQMEMASIQQKIDWLKEYVGGEPAL